MLKSLFQSSFEGAKIASEATDRMLNVGTAIVAASARERLLAKAAAQNGQPAASATNDTKTATQTAPMQLQNETRDADQAAMTVEGVQEAVLRNSVKPGKIHATGTVVDTPAPAAPMKAAEAQQLLGDLLLAAGTLGVINHAKVAAFAPELFEKVACPTPGHVDGSCGFCGGYGLPKQAYEEAIANLDALTDIDVTMRMGKVAADAAEGMSQGDMQMLAGPVAAGLEALDSAALDAKLHPAEAPPRSFGGLSYRYHPLAGMLGTNFQF